MAENHVALTAEQSREGRSSTAAHLSDVVLTVERSLTGDDNASADQRRAASTFLFWPCNNVDLAQRDEDLPKLVDALARFIARREANAAQAATSDLLRELQIINDAWCGPSMEDPGEFFLFMAARGPHIRAAIAKATALGE